MNESTPETATALPDTPPPLSFGVRTAFGVGQIAEGIQAAVFLMFLLFFYNHVLGVSGTLCGLALAISLLFDAVTDPVLGNLSDAWRSKWGRRHPFMYAAALPLGIFFYLLFNPLVTGEIPLFFWLLGMTVCCRGAMTFYHVPHSALGAELSDDYHERTLLVATRHFFGAIAFIGVFALAFLVYFVPTPDYPNGQLNPAAYGPLTGWLSLAMVVTIWYSAYGTRSRIPYLPKARDGQVFSFVNVVGNTAQAIKNPSFRAIIIGFAIIIIAFGAAGALNLYMLTFFWQMGASGIFVALLAGPIGSMFGYIFAKPVFNALDKKRGVLLGIAIWFVGHGISVPLFLMGALPAPGSAGLLMFVAGLSAAASVGIALLLVGLGTMLADIADEHELQHGERNEGIFFGAFSLTNKCSAALGSLIGGVALDLLAWPTGPSIRTAADVPQEVINNLGLVWGPMAIFLAIPSLWVITRYKLNRQRHAEILSELAERNGVTST